MVGKVANPNDVLQFFKKKQYEPVDRKAADAFDAFDDGYEEKLTEMINNTDANKHYLEKLMIQCMRK